MHLDLLEPSALGGIGIVRYHAGLARLVDHVLRALSNLSAFTILLFQITFPLR